MKLADLEHTADWPNLEPAERRAPERGRTFDSPRQLPFLRQFSPLARAIRQSVEQQSALQVFAEAFISTVATLIFAGVKTFDGLTPPLTGSEALDPADLALIASGLIGTPIVREAVSGATYRDSNP